MEIFYTSFWYIEDKINRIMEKLTSNHWLLQSLLVVALEFVISLLPCFLDNDNKPLLNLKLV